MTRPTLHMSDPCSEAAPEAAPDAYPERHRVGFMVLAFGALLVLPFGLVLWTVRALVLWHRRRHPSPVEAAPARPLDPSPKATPLAV